MIWWIRNWFRERRIRKELWRNILIIEKTIEKNMKREDDVSS